MFSSLFLWRVIPSGILSKSSENDGPHQYSYSAYLCSVPSNPIISISSAISTLISVSRSFSSFFNKGSENVFNETQIERNELLKEYQEHVERVYLAENEQSIDMLCEKLGSHIVGNSQSYTTAL